MGEETKPTTETNNKETPAASSEPTPTENAEASDKQPATPTFDLPLESQWSFGTVQSLLPMKNSIASCASWDRSKLFKDSRTSMPIWKALLSCLRTRITRSSAIRTSQCGRHSLMEVAGTCIW